MILSRGRGYLFVHIPKTGGTALSLALEARAMKDDILIGDTPKAMRRRKKYRDVKTRGRLWKHASRADIEGLVPAEELDRLFTFTIIRNPWDRLVSYYHWCQDQNFTHSAVQLSQSLEFSDFVMHPKIQTALRRAPYWAFVTDSQGRDRGDLFIRIENFAQDARPLWDHLGFELELPRANMSRRRSDYRGYYSTQAAEAVRQICAKDIQRFGYNFE